MKGSFLYPNLLLFLWVIPLTGLLFYLSFKRREKLLSRFATMELLSQIKPKVSIQRRFWKVLGFLLALVFIVITFARPRWGEYYHEVQRKGRDIMVLLDLSNSMLAEDIVPNRLLRVKLDLRDFVNSLEGDRIGLIGFAGRSEILCPLTSDYGFFNLVLEECGPGTVPLGGTMIGDAIRKGVASLTRDEKKEGEVKSAVKSEKAILLITDGEDHDSFPVEASEQAKDSSIPIFILGVGDTKEGKRIPITDEKGRRFLTYKGEEVWSRMNKNLMVEIALKTGGAFASCTGGTDELSKIYQIIKDKTATRDYGSVKRARYLYERFQIFLFFAILFFFIESFIEEGTQRRQKMETNKGKVILLLPIILLFLCEYTLAQNPTDLVKEGNKLWSEQKYTDAFKKYKEAEISLPDNPYILYNMANSYYGEKKWDKALELYKRAFSPDNSEFGAKVGFNIGCTYYRKATDLMSRASDLDQIKEVVDLLRQSLSRFRDVLETFPDNKEARDNISLVKIHLKDFLDRLHKKEQEEREKARTSLVILTEIRQGEKDIVSRLLSFKEKDKEQISTLKEPQDKISEKIPEFKNKLKSELDEDSKKGDPQKKDKESEEKKAKFLKSVESLADQAKEIMAQASEKLGKKDPQALSDAKVALKIIDTIWKALAPPELILGEDINIQKESLGKTEKLDEKSTPENWEETKETQQEAEELTAVFKEKITKMPVGQENPSSPQNGKEKLDRIVKLSEEAEKYQKDALEHLLKRKSSEAKKSQEEAITALKKIAKEMSSPQKDQQNTPQQKQSPQQNENKKDEKRQQDKKKDKENLKKEEANEILRQAKEREKKHKEKEAELVPGNGRRVIDDRDW